MDALHTPFGCSVIIDVAGVRFHNAVAHWRSGMARILDHRRELARRGRDRHFRGREQDTAEPDVVAYLRGLFSAFDG